MAKKPVTLLGTPERKPCADTVAALRAMLARAESGEVDGLLMIVAYPQQAGEGKGFGSVFVGSCEADMVSFIGMLEVLKTRLMYRVEIPERGDD